MPATGQAAQAANNPTTTSNSPTTTAAQPETAPAALLIPTGPSTNTPPTSVDAAFPPLELVEGLESWRTGPSTASMTGNAVVEGAIARTQEDQQSASPAPSASDRPSLSPISLPQIARTIGADGWMVPWMAAAFAIATCFGSFYIFAVRRS